MEISHYGYKSPWQDHDEVDAHTGDKIDFDRAYGLYYHSGIADGYGGVYHYSANEGNSIIAKNNARYRHDRIKDIANGQKVRVNNTVDKICDPKPTDEIIRRAEEKLGTGKGEYDAWGFNCEHNTTDTRNGEPISQQASWWENVGWTLTTIVTGVAAVAAFIFRR